MMKIILASICAMFLLSGCVTMIDLGQAMCEAAIGGSKAASLCDELDQLRDSGSSEEAPSSEVSEEPTE